MKDLLVNVGSGGGAAAAPTAGGGATAGGAAAADEPSKEEEKKEEGMRSRLHVCVKTLTLQQKRKNPTRIWASVYSTDLFDCFSRLLVLIPKRLFYRATARYLRGHGVGGLK